MLNTKLLLAKDIITKLKMSKIFWKNDHLKDITIYHPIMSTKLCKKVQFCKHNHIFLNRR